MDNDTLVQQRHGTDAIVAMERTVMMMMMMNMLLLLSRPVWKLIVWRLHRVWSEVSYPTYAFGILSIDVESNVLLCERAMICVRSSRLETKMMAPSRFCTVDFTMFCFAWFCFL